MNYLRNPEIKRELIVIVLLWMAGLMAGFLFFREEGVLFAALVCGMFSFLHIFSSYMRYRRIAGLSDEISRFLHGQKVEIGQQSEGELAVLENEISRMTGKLQKQAEELREEKVFLSNSIADISHQIRTPLTALNLIVSRLGSEEMSESKRKMLIYELESLLSHIDWLVQTLLKIAKLDAGTIVLKAAPVSVKELIASSTEALMIPIELREQKLSVEVEDGTGYTGDMAWTREALGNIVKNCMEHTPVGGEIRIYAKENPIYTEICVEDSGAGFSRKDLAHLFDRFYRGENSSEKSVGIGLALARMVVARQNGILTAENRLEGGARFVIRFYKGVV